MKILINDKEWEIIELENGEFYDKRKKLLEEERTEVRDDGFVFGFCLYSFHEIYLNKNQCKEEMKSTLIHELIHAWLWCYGTAYSSYCEDSLCDTVAATNKFINDTVNKYFGRDKK